MSVSSPDQPHHTSEPVESEMAAPGGGRGCGCGSVSMSVSMSVRVSVRPCVRAAVGGDEAENGQASSHQVLTDSYERHDGMQRNGTATTPHSVRS